MLLLYTHILYKGGSNGVEWNVYYTPFNVVPLKKFNEHYTYHINDACNALLIGSSCGLFLFFLSNQLDHCLMIVAHFFFFLLK